MNYIKKIFLSKLLEFFNYDINEEILFKYVSGYDYHIDSIFKNYFYFSRIREVNDPEDCKIDPVLDISNLSHFEVENFFIKHSVYKNKSLAKKAAKNFISNPKIKEKFKKDYESKNASDDQRFLNTFKMLCLTRNFKSYHMWKNYAKKNKPLDGFCIGYSAEKGIPVKIVNNHKTYKVSIMPNQVYLGNVSLNFYVANEVFYGNFDTIPYNPFKSNKDDLTHAYYYKKEKWSKEEEFRILLIDNFTRNQKTQKIKYPPKILKYIIFGENCPKDVIESVKNAIMQNGNYQNVIYLKAFSFFGKIIIKKIC